jgi:hypothetical protein
MVFVDKLVLKKNLSQFLEIHLQLAGIRVTKTCLEQEIMKLKNRAPRFLESPNP